MTTWLSCATVSVALVACGGGSGSSDPVPTPTPTPTPTPVALFQVGLNPADPDLPAEPTLPADTQVCATLYASNNLIRRPDGALPPEADPSPTLTAAGANIAPVTATWPADGTIYTTTIYPAGVVPKANPDQARIQAALNACGLAVDAEVGAAIAAADASATAAQVAAAIPNKLISGASSQELAKAKYKASKYAVRLVVNSTGGGDSFISGPLTLPSGVTLWIDKDVTLFASRDVAAYSMDPTGAAASRKYCGNTAYNTTSGASFTIKAGSSSNCQPLIGGSNMVNSAVVGEGSIDSRGYAEIVTSVANYPLMKVDLTCSNTYAAYIANPAAPAANGTPCDNGGTFVDRNSSSRNMTWWDLAFLANMVESGTTGVAGQSVFRMMVFDYAKNLTLYKITMNNSANFHMVPSGIDGLTVWGVKLQTPSLAAFANPAGNGNPLYTGFTFTKDNVKNTDAFDPGAAGGVRSAQLTTGATPATYNSKLVLTASTKGKISFDGYLKNVVFAYNYVSTGDDNIVLKGSNNPCKVVANPTAANPTCSGQAGIDGNRDVSTDRKYGIMIAHNHIYDGHGVSIGSETNAGVKNVQVYDNAFDGGEEALRIKTDYARGGEVSNIFYKNICIRNSENALLFTPYYSTKAIDPAKGVLFPNIHDISLDSVAIQGATKVKLMGFEANTGGFGNPQYPLVMTLNNVVTNTPTGVNMISSDANLTLTGVNNLPIVASTDRRIVVTGTASPTADITKVVDCSKAFVAFPSLTSPQGTLW